MAEGGEYNNSDVADVKPTSVSPGIGSATLAEGENVNLKFTKCPVNVVARDQINVNKIVYNITGAEGESPSGIKKKASALIKCINDNAYQKTADKILEDIGADDLSKPDFQVHPQMRWVTKSEYFKGNYEEVHGMEVAVKRKLFFWKKEEVVKNEFRKEFGFLRQNVDDNKFIELDKVLEQFINEKSSITAIVASAGSGKTTLMRRIARKAVGDSLTNTETIASPSQLKYKLIRYIEIKGMRHKGLIKPSKFLFDGLFQNEIDEDNAYWWLLEHQSEAVLFFDGLDQATWKINRDGDEDINPYSKAKAKTIMYNILSRNILADTKIVFSSREFQVSDLPVKARPADIITLSGLTLDDAKTLFVLLLRRHGDEAWKKIETMSPRLINLVSIPVFLVLTAVIMAKNPDKPPPKTVTGLYKKIISNLSSVNNITQADAIAGVINKLKAMAYRGMKEGRVTFSENHLNKFGLSKEEVRDLMMKVPGNKLLSCKVLDGSFIFFFCHQSLQEFLAAGFIVEMTLTKFISFNSIHLHKERWSVVRRFVCGLIYDETPDNLYEVSNQSLKKQILGGSIRSQLKSKEDKQVRMELYTAIYESGDDALMRRISDIDTSKISLSRDEAHIVGSLAVKSESLDCLNLHNCNIDDDLLAIITGSLEKGIQVKKVDLRSNNFSAKALRSLLGHLRIESLSRKLDWEVVKLTVDGGDVELKNEEDVIKISGDGIDGHFDFKDSSLSFKKVSVVALKYVSDLFDATFVKLIEKLVAQEVGLRKISEYRIEKVKELDLRNNKVPATALRSFLGHRLIESLSGKLDWEVVKLTVDGWDVDLKNEEDVIKISGNWIEGHMKDSNLSFNWAHAVKDVAFLGILFDAEFIKFEEQMLLMAKQDDLQKLSEFKLNKISKILLDCTKEENIDWSLIETCWKKYQLDLLDIAVDGLMPDQDYSRILERRTAISVPVHIHAMFYVGKADEFRKASEACQQKKIEYIRCIFNFGFGASLDDISSLVNNCNLKKVTLSYRNENDMLKGAELQKVQKIVNDLDTELEVLELPPFFALVEDAWQRLDYDFYWRQ